MNDHQVLERFDAWLKDDSPVAALVMHQRLISVEGKDAVIFPPTYAVPEGTKKEDWLGYNIDRLENGLNVCQIDSVGSQANRMEPIFKREPYCKLVPQVIINAGDKKVNLLDAGHRAADAIVRFSSLAQELKEAFLSVRDSGNAEPLARIAPTSIIFGSWDSRSTRTKLPRIVRSVIRAFQVDMLHRSAQYTTLAGEILEDTEVEVATRGPQAELGLAHVPAPWTHGGVRVREGGEIRRDASLNLVAIRALGIASQNEDEILKLRRYILGLALVSFTAPQESFLREGCQLVPDIDCPVEWKLVHHDGHQDPCILSHEEVLAYAEAAAKAFGVGEGRNADFKPDIARSELAKSREERRGSRRRD